MKMKALPTLLLLVLVGVLMCSCSSEDEKSKVVIPDKEIDQDKDVEEIVCTAENYKVNISKGREQFDLSKWELAWEDEFDYPDKTLDEGWNALNAAYDHILSSRWRENAVVKDGVLELQAKKENRGHGVDSC